MDKNKNDAVLPEELTEKEVVKLTVEEFIRLFGSKPLKAEWFVNQPKKKNTKKTKKEKKKDE